MWDRVFEFIKEHIVNLLKIMFGLGLVLGAVNTYVFLTYIISQGYFAVVLYQFLSTIVIVFFTLVVSTGIEVLSATGLVVNQFGKKKHSNHHYEREDWN